MSFWDGFREGYRNAETTSGAPRTPRAPEPRVRGTCRVQGRRYEGCPLDLIDRERRFASPAPPNGDTDEFPWGL